MQEVAAHQEGSRWVDARPSGDEVAAWFATSVPMHDGMNPAKYVGGVTLIPNVDKYKTTVENDDGERSIVERERLVYQPYMKVETRVAYFWDLCELRGWVGVIEPVRVARMTEAAHFNANLPDGFFRFPTKKMDGKVVHQVGCSMQVRVFSPDVRSGGRGKSMMEPAAGTKIVNTLNRWGEDPFALMKAETGAVGRALGMAGMLVIPGSGVATAEDVLEAMNPDNRNVGMSDGAEAAQLPEEPADIGAHLMQLIGGLESDHPEIHKEFQAWAQLRGLNLAEATDQQRRGAARWIEKALAA